MQRGQQTVEDPVAAARGFQRDRQQKDWIGQGAHDVRADDQIERDEAAPAGLTPESDRRTHVDAPCLHPAFIDVFAVVRTNPLKCEFASLLQQLIIRPRLF
jgi:hypothetical protein